MNKDIFRAYDIRGVFNDSLTKETAYLIGRAFGTKIKSMNQDRTVVGYDNRESSITIFEELTKGIMEAGVTVYSIGLCTTPMLYFSFLNLNVKSGIMITASHNPKEYNGFKMSFNGLFNAHGHEIQEFRDFILKGEFSTGNGGFITCDIKTKYVDYLLSEIKIDRPLKIVFDAGNGSTTCIIKDILDRLEIDYVPLFFDSDSNFPNHHPDPSVASNLADLRAKVLEVNADAGFAFDGDGDRIGMVDEIGNIIEPDKIMIIAVRDILKSLSDKRILFDVKCTTALRDEIVKLGGIPIESRTGNSYLLAAMVKEKYMLAGEFSGHIFFNDKFSGFDDAIYVALRMIEILSKKDVRCSELLNGINKFYNTDEMKIRVTDKNKFVIVEKFIELAKSRKLLVETLDGCKIITESGFVLVRASNTGPDLSLRIEDKSFDELDRLKDYWLSEITSIIETTK